MKKNPLLIFVFLLSLFSIGAGYNKESSYIVIEKTTNRILEGENINNKMLVASTAKILTAITTIENYDLNEVITITKNDSLAIGSSIYLKEGEQITRKDLLYALILRSANDAASALSNNNSIDFIYKMNELAKKIGMLNSTFSNASGLDEKEYNLSTAYDMAILASYASKNEEFLEIAKAHNYVSTSSLISRTFINKHKLVNSLDEFIWGKTGYTKKSHRVLVSNYQKNNMDLIIVTINNSDDWNFHKTKANSFNNYYFEEILKPGIYSLAVDDEVFLVVDERICIALKKEEINNIKYKIFLYQDYSYIYVYLKNEIIFKKRLDVMNKNNISV